MKYKKIHMRRRGYNLGWTLCGGHKFLLRTNSRKKVTCKNCIRIAGKTSEER